ncbi:MAG: LysR family transcriptional regulator [Streptosporangiales bacterium]|nr:LysR family transcriptional regulator [Streptosporangiales bacterium]
MLDPRRVLIFREIARAGSLAAAARNLGWTQPAISQHLRQLERDAGCPLVTRQARGVRLTEAGHVLLAHADAIAARLRGAEQELSALADLNAGTVRMAAFPSGSAALVPRAMAHLADTHPGLDLRLREAEPPEAIELVRTGEVDLALVFDYRTPGRERELVFRELGDDPVRIVLPADHPAAPGPPAATTGAPALGSLAGERWIAGCERCSEHLYRVCAAAGFTPDVRHSTDDYVITQSLVAQGLGVALLPQLALDSYHRPDVVVRDLVEVGHRRIFLAHHRETSHLPAVAAAARSLTRAHTDARTRIISDR